MSNFTEINKNESETNLFMFNVSVHIRCFLRTGI